MLINTLTLMQRTYKKYRAKGWRAESAWAMARQAQADYDMPWEDSNENAVVKSARVTCGGFDFVIKVLYDEDSSSTDFASGHFSETWEPNAVNSDEFQRAQHSYGRRYSVRYPRRMTMRKSPKYIDYSRFHNYLSESRYFVPDESLRVIADAYAKMGYARHAAWLKAWEQVRQDEALAAGKDYATYGVEVTAYLHDTQVELAHESCWGIQIDDDESYLTEVANDLILEATHDAEQNIPHRLEELHDEVMRLEAQAAMLEFYPQAQ